jgi:hypothetical protein
MVAEDPCPVNKCEQNSVRIRLGRLPDSMNILVMPLSRHLIIYYRDRQGKCCTSAKRGLSSTPGVAKAVWNGL